MTPNSVAGDSMWEDPVAPEYLPIAYMVFKRISQRGNLYEPFFVESIYLEFRLASCSEVADFKIPKQHLFKGFLANCFVLLMVYLSSSAPAGFWFLESSFYLYFKFSAIAQGFKSMELYCLFIWTMPEEYLKPNCVFDLSVTCVYRSCTSVSCSWCQDLTGH